MNVAVAEEPQKKIFRARKTMKLSDRQQLDTLHNILSSPSTTPPPVNGKHPVGGQIVMENDKENQDSVDSSSPFPISVSPSAVAGTQEMAGSPLSSRFAVKDSEAEMEKVDGECTEDDGKGPETGGPKQESDGSRREASPPPATELALVGSDVSLEISGDIHEEKQGTAGDDAVSMETNLEGGAVMLATLSPQSPIAPGNMTTSSPSLSPSHAPESDQEVKEGFLVLSEEDESQGERDEEKEVGDKGEEHGEKMETDSKLPEEEDSMVAADPESPQSSTPAPPLGETDRGESTSPRVVRKRRLSAEAKEAEQQVQEGMAEENHEKRPRVRGEELEAELELKISGKAGSWQQLEKVVQRLVAEQLRVLQLTVFDRSLQELRERVERIDCTTKHQHSLNTLQAKIARLTKKFGAANRAKDNNSSKSQEVSGREPRLELAPPPSSAAAMATKPTSSAVPTCRTNTVRAMLESKRGEQQSPFQTELDYAGIPNARKLPPSFMASTSVTRAPSCSTASTSSSSASSTSITSVASSCPQNRLPPSTLMAPPGPTPQSVSLQPLLIQLPLAVSGSQAGPMASGHSPGVELIPMNSLTGANTLSKAKTNTAGTTFILQKTVAPSSSSLPVPPSAPLPQISLARAAVYSGGSGVIGVPSPGVSVSSARTPAQCAPAVGVTSSLSSPSSSAPAATGGQTPGLSAAGPAPMAMMASKTDSQTISRAGDPAAAKMPAQVSRTSSSGAVIDLTDDDDDVQVTGVKRAPVQSGHNIAPHPTSSSATYRAPGAPPSLTGGNHNQQTVRASPQGQHIGNGPQLTVHHRPQQESQSKKYPSAPLGQASTSSVGYGLIPPLPPPPSPPARLPPEAAHTSLPQQPQLKLARVQSQNGIVLSWSVAEVDRTCAPVDSYHLYAYHQDAAASPASQWKKIGEVKALALPMACTLTQFVSGSKYYFAVRARDIYGRFGPFCEPQCTDVIAPSSSA